MKTKTRNEMRWKTAPEKASTHSTEDRDNPFLCADCQKLGYCRIGAEDRKKKEQVAERNRSTFVMDDQAIRNLVPLHSKDSKGKYSQQHLGVAYDAFYQEDYETAILHLMAILESGIDPQASHVGLAVSHYFLKNYDTALDFALQYETGTYYRSDKMQDFIVHCGNCLKGQQAEAIEKEKQNEKEADLAVKQLLSENRPHPKAKKSSNHTGSPLTHSVETVRV